MSETTCLPRLIRSDGQEFVVSGSLTVGRSSECSLQLEDTLVSRRHALLEMANQQVTITDLDSHNGTWVNDRKITAPTILRDGDRLRIGKTAFVFKALESASVVHDDVSAPSPAVPAEGGGTVESRTTEPLALVRSADGAEFGLSRSMRLGRSETNDLVLKGDSSASQFHAQIDLVNGQPVIIDLKSRNGVWVNGKRISVPTPLSHSDKIRVGDTIFRLRVGRRPLPASEYDNLSPRAKWGRWIASAMLSLACSFIAWSLWNTIVGTPPTNPQPDPPQVAVDVDATQTAARQNALRAVVFVEVISANAKHNGQSVLVNLNGSGSLLSSDGYILTNFHLIGIASTNTYEEESWDRNEGDLYDDQELVLIGLNPSGPDLKPDTFYRCEIAGRDPDLDLAVLHVIQVAQVNGNKDPLGFIVHPERPDSLLWPADWSFGGLPSDVVFKTVPVGDSDHLQRFDKVFVAGFPTIGENTVTSTDGSVSGFLFSSDERTRQWIKTDTEISEGNSGGMAINQDGELVGIPTAGRTSESGGRINYIRPINLAHNLIKSACPVCLP